MKNEEIQEHIKALYDRIDGIKDSHQETQLSIIRIGNQLQSLTERLFSAINEVEKKISENKLDDFKSNQEIQEEIKLISQTSGKKTAKKVSAIITVIGTVIASILSVILGG